MIGDCAKSPYTKSYLVTLTDGSKTELNDKDIDGAIWGATRLATKHGESVSKIELWEIDKWIDTGWKPQ